MEIFRKSGILLHISSLGKDAMGEKAVNFLDFLKKSGQSYWQVLPINPVGKGDSPYYCISGAAGNPMFIDVGLLEKEGLLTKLEHDLLLLETDYRKYKNKKNELLKIAFARFEETGDYRDFLEKNKWWLRDYSLYKVLVEKFGGAFWFEWQDEKLKRRDATALENAYKENFEEINLYNIEQYFFSKQWFNLKAEAEKREIRIIGDIPFYVPLESVEAWASQSSLRLDEDLLPEKVGGVPPDYFSKDGQLWNFPVYDWEFIKKNDYKFWIDRINASARYFDIIRLDHFRGFSEYWAVPYNAKTARKGRWEKGPSTEFINIIKETFDDKEFIAEDLGKLTFASRRLQKKSGFLGMKVLQFAEKEKIKKYKEKTVCYTGTHDNDTIRGYIEEKKKNGKYKKIKKHFGLRDGEEENWEFIRICFESPSILAIIPMQDLLDLDSDARMNIPGTSEGNWRWQLNHEYLDEELIQKLLDYTKKTNRV